MREDSRGQQPSPPSPRHHPASVLGSRGVGTGDGRHTPLCLPSPGNALRPTPLISFRPRRHTCALAPTKPATWPASSLLRAGPASPIHDAPLLHRLRRLRRVGPQPLRPPPRAARRGHQAGKAEGERPQPHDVGDGASRRDQAAPLLRAVRARGVGREPARGPRPVRAAQQGRPRRGALQAVPRPRVANVAATGGRVAHVA